MPSQDSSGNPQEGDGRQQPGVSPRAELHPGRVGVPVFPRSEEFLGGPRPGRVHTSDHRKDAQSRRPRGLGRRHGGMLWNRQTGHSSALNPLRVAVSHPAKDPAAPRYFQSVSSRTTMPPGFTLFAAELRRTLYDRYHRSQLRRRFLPRSHDGRDVLIGVIEAPRSRSFDSDRRVPVLSPPDEPDIGCRAALPYPFRPFIL